MLEFDRQNVRFDLTNSRILAKYKNLLDEMEKFIRQNVRILDNKNLLDKC